MTKSVTIVNTSNWEGEDVYLNVMKQPQDMENKTGFPDLERYVILKPGESFEVGDWHYEVIRMEDANKKNKGIKPFKNKSGKQVCPQVEVKFK